MRTKKRNTVYAVLAAFIISLLTACSGSAKTETTPASDTDTADTQTEQTTQQPEETTEEVVEDVSSEEEEEVPYRDQGIWYAGGLTTNGDEISMKVALFRLDGDPVAIVEEKGMVYYGEYETEDAKFDDGAEYTLITIWDHKFGYHFNDDGSGFVVDEGANKYDAVALDEAGAMEMMEATGINEEEEGGYSFVEEQSGMSDFKDYDDLIAHLQSGQGYAYIKLTGADDDVLAITQTVFEADNSSYEAYLYLLNEDGTPVYLGVVTANGSSYPLRAADGILYAGDNHNYESYFISSEYHSLMMKDCVSDGVGDGSNEYTGFLRDSNNFDNDKDFTGGAKEFDKLISDRESKPIVEFTKVQ